MKPFKERTTFTQPTQLPAELADNLTYLEKCAEPATEDEKLFNDASDLLTLAGVKATIDGAKVTVTKYAHPFTAPNSDRTFYARIAEYDNDPLANTRARVIFDNSPDVDTVTTGDAAALIFCDMVGTPTLLAYEGTEPIIDNDDYRALTRRIIDDITRQYDDEQQRVLVERRHKRNKILGKVGAGAGVIVVAGAATLGVYATDDKVGPEQETAASSEVGPGDNAAPKSTTEAPSINSHYGVCTSGGLYGTSGMACDYDLWSDGSFIHTERVSVMGFTAQNSYRACKTPEGILVATDSNPKTPC